MHYPEELNQLILLLNRLPGVGRRSAERMALAILRDKEKLAARLARALHEAGETIVPCTQCGSLTRREANPCRLCTDPSRDDQWLCMVEEPTDIGLIEQAGVFRGRYFALMGKLSAIRGEGPEHLRIRELMKRLRERSIREVLLALNSDVESDATASYLTELCNGAGVKVSRLARGLPSGSGIAYSDAQTLKQAIQYRVPM